MPAIRWRTMAHEGGVSVDAGKTAALVWTFARTPDLEFACNIPGHYEDGMKGTIRLREVREAAMKSLINAALAIAFSAPLPALAATYDLVIDRTDRADRGPDAPRLLHQRPDRRPDPALEGGRGGDDQRHQPPQGGNLHPLARHLGAVRAWTAFPW